MAIEYQYDISKVFVQDEGDVKDVVRKIFATITVKDSDYPDITYSVNAQINIDSPKPGETVIPYSSLTKGQIINMIETSKDGPGLRSMLVGSLYQRLQEKNYKEKELPWKL